MFEQTHPVQYIPIATTLLSLFFAAQIFRRYQERGKGKHLLWWSAGVLVYGLGTFAESWITLFGWNIVIFKFWYIVGALLGGAPLAQGTVWLLLQSTTARRYTRILVGTVAAATICVLFSPVDMSLVNPHLPSGKVFIWQWVRIFSPFINTYAVIFLIGGAIVSAVRFHKHTATRDRYIGNVLIAIGAIMPGIGGSFTRFGYTEVLYVTEITGIILIWFGYWYNIRNRPVKQELVSA